MTSRTKLNLIIPSRIHITLLAMDSPIYRLNGGMGFAITGHDLELNISLSEEFSIYDLRTCKLSASHSQKLISILKKVKKQFNISNCISVEIINGPNAHIGFGSGTAFSMGIVEAYLTITRTPFNSSDIVHLSERGGTSGVGINTYFEGGFVFDLGKKYHSGDVHKPTSFNEDKGRLPLKLIRTNMPNWDFGIFTPDNVNVISGTTELDFFSRTCPIPHEEASITLYHGVFGILAAVLEADKSAFCKGINSIQNTFWKKSEIDQYDKKFENTIFKIKSKCLAVGLSSMGPTLFFLSENLDEVKNYIKENSIKGTFTKVKANNTGRIIKYV